MRALLIAALLAALLGCSEGGQQRGLFTGYVTDKTEAEVAEKVGKPNSVDNSNPNTLRWVYKKKTFDPDNLNKVDDETVLIFQKDKDGKFRVKQVVFG